VGDVNGQPSADLWPFPALPEPPAGGVDGFIVALDAGGNYLWGRRLGTDGEDGATDVAVGVDGNIVVVGYAQGDLDFGSGPEPAHGGFDAFVVKLTGGGATMWTRRFGGGFDDIARAVDVNPYNEDHIAVTGEYGDKIDFDGTIHVSAGGQDAFAVRLKATGGRFWSASYGGPSHDRGHGIALSPNGYPAITGEYRKDAVVGWPLVWHGGSDVFTVFADPYASTTIWACGDGGTGNDAGMDVDFGNGDNLHIVGTKVGDISICGGAAMPGLGGTDGFYAHVGAFPLTPVCSTSLGSAGNDRGWDVVAETWDSMAAVATETDTGVNKKVDVSTRNAGCGVVWNETIDKARAEDAHNLGIGLGLAAHWTGQLTLAADHSDTPFGFLRSWF
jgi:hypothetical protein